MRLIQFYCAAAGTELVTKIIIFSKTTGVKQFDIFEQFFSIISFPLSV